MKIKTIKISDYQEIISLWKQDNNIRLSNADTKENIKIFLKRNKGMNFKIVIENKIVGTILCGNDGRRGYFHHLFIDEEYRKNGYGKILVDKCIRKLQEKHISKIHIFVLPGNIEGQMFWKKLGFFKRSEDDIFMFSKDI